MRFIKLAFISVIVLFIIITAISSLLPSKVLVSRAVDMKGSTAKVKQQVFQLNNWQSWMTDAQGEKGERSFDSATQQLKIGITAVQHISSTDSTIVTRWLSSNTMIGTMRIINHKTPDSLITVQWQMEQKVKWYPWEKFAAITKDELWGGSMEKSLENLKAIVEVQ